MKSVTWLFLISLLIKLILSALIPLSADEAYYWVWSHKLQLSYFDHPPMVAWLFYLGHFLEPFANAVRWPAVILGHATLGVGYLILKDIWDTKKIKTWMLLVLFSPLLGFGSLIVTPDLPVIFFWTLSIYFTIQVLNKKDVSSYALLGMALGLGFCAKYHIVLFVPCLLAYLLFEKRIKDINWFNVPITIFTGLLFCLPVLMWNYQNDFQSFKFQLNHGLSRPDYDISWTTSYLGAQLLILFPLTVWAAIKGTNRNRLFAYFAWGPLFFFFLTSFKALVEANWPIIAYPTFFILAASFQKIEKWLKVYVVFWGIITTLVVAALFIPQVRSLNSKINEPFEFQQLAAESKSYEPLYASSYQMASSLWYFSKRPVYKLKDISRFDFFDTLPEAIPQQGPFYLLERQNNGLPGWIKEQGWNQKLIKSIEPDLILLEFTKP